MRDPVLTLTLWSDDARHKGRPVVIDADQVVGEPVEQERGLGAEPAKVCLVRLQRGDAYTLADPDRTVRGKILAARDETPGGR